MKISYIPLTLTLPQGERGLCNYAPPLMGGDEGEGGGYL